jgi:multisubunit Na+/H+ antiporter MnhG subunit
LVGSIALELLLVALVVKRFQAAGERTFFLAILFVVGVHFLPMALAFGPLCVALGAAAIANASVGLWRMRDAPLTTLWLMDGAIKILFGGLMYASGGL